MRQLPLILLLAAGCGGTLPAAVSPSPPPPTAGTPPPPAEVAVLAPAGEPAAAARPAEQPRIARLDGLETWPGWFAEKWPGTNPLTTSLQEHPRLGKCLRLETPGGEGDKAACGLLLSGSYADDDGVRLDLYNPQPRPVQLAVGLFLTQKRLYFESPIITVAPGYSTHTVPLKKPVWKCRRTGWRHQARPDGLEDTVQIDLLLYEEAPAQLLVAYLHPPRAVEQGPPREEEASPAAGGILTPRQEERLRRRLSAEDRRAIRQTLRALEEEARAKEEK